MTTPDIVFFFMELYPVEYVMLRYQSPMLAAAPVYSAQCTLRRVPSCNEISNDIVVTQKYNFGDPNICSI